MAAESTRRFTKNLLKPGSAAEIRQTACNAVRHCAVTVSTPLWIVRRKIIYVYKTTCRPLPLRDDTPKPLHRNLDAMRSHLAASVRHAAPLHRSCSRPGIDIHVASFFAVGEHMQLRAVPFSFCLSILQWGQFNAFKRLHLG